MRRSLAVEARRLAAFSVAHGRPASARSTGSSAHEAGDLEAVAGHARHAARAAEQLHAARRRDRAGSARRCRRCAGPSAATAGARRGCARSARGSSAAASSPQLSSTAAPRSPRCSARERARQRPGVVAGAGVEQVEHRQRLVHAHQHLVARRPAAVRQRQVQAAGAVAVGGAVELALLRSASLRLPVRSISDSLRLRCSIRLGDGADLQAVLRRRTRSGRAGAPSCRRRS